MNTSGTNANNQWPLTTDLSKLVFKHLEARDLGRCGSVCKDWKKSLDTDAMWESVLRQAFELPPDVEFKAPKETYENWRQMITWLAKGQDVCEIDLGDATLALPAARTQAVWNSCHVVASDTGQLSCGSITVPRAHRGKIYTVAVLDGIIFTGAHGGTLSAWDPSNGLQRISVVHDFPASIQNIAFRHGGLICKILKTSDRKLTASGETVDTQDLREPPKNEKKPKTFLGFSGFFGINRHF